MKFLDETEADDPILSVVNLIDVFLVVIAALLITVAKNPLLSPFSKQDVTVITDAGKPAKEIVPASLDITRAKQELRVGDRLLPEPERESANYVPHAPTTQLQGQVVSVYGNAVRYAAQNQVVAINRGRQHGLERGHVLALQRGSDLVVDGTDSARPNMRLPGERNGLMMVFRTFDRVSYALVLQIEDGVQVGDRFGNP